MEPKLPIHNPGLERVPTGYSQSAEQTPAVSTPERAIEYGTERFERSAEVAPAAPAQPILPTLIGVVAESPPVPISTAVAVDDDAATSNPLVAKDDDLIEKEWVDKAKKIITQTKDDPYRREYEVGKLQADYLRKRYGREIGA